MIETKVLDVISNKLYANFGSEYIYYTEKIEQGFQEPSFSIKILENIEVSFLGEDVVNSYNIEVLYFPRKTTKQREECYSVSPKVVQLLKELYIGDCVLECTEFNTKVVDSVLIINLSYNYYSIKEDEDNEELIEDINIDLKESV